MSLSTTKFFSIMLVLMPLLCVPIASDSSETMTVDPMAELLPPEPNWDSLRKEIILDLVMIQGKCLGEADLISIVKIIELQLQRLSFGALSELGTAPDWNELRKDLVRCFVIQHGTGSALAGIEADQMIFNARALRAELVKKCSELCRQP